MYTSKETKGNQRSRFKERVLAIGLQRKARHSEWKGSGLTLSSNTENLLMEPVTPEHLPD